MPDLPLDLSAMDIQAGEDEEEVSDEAVLAVLAEIAGSDLKSGKAIEDRKAKEDSAAAGSSKAPRNNSCGDRLNDRIEEFTKAAIACKHRGQQRGYAEWMCRAKDLVAAVDELLNTEFVAPSSARPQDPRGSVEPPPPASSNASADAAFDHIVSLKVVEYEAARLAGNDSALAALDKRRTTLATLEQRRAAAPVDHAGFVASAGYGERLQRAIDEEKERAREAKRDGDTRTALDALRRAKIMSDELEQMHENPSP